MEAKRDANRVTTLLGVSNVDGTTPVTLYADPTTHRLLVSSDAGAGTVTSVAALTLGTTGTDLSSTVANGTTTPVITLNVPTASASNRGALSSADWTTFNAKAPSTSPTFATSITGSYLTASEILITDADKKIVSAPVATYPSLTELSYVKGVTSAIQTQLGGKITDPMTTRGDIIFRNATVPARLAKGTAGQVLTMGADDPEWADASSGGTSLWTAITATRVSNTTCTVTGDQTAIFKKGMIVRWQESGVDKVGMISIPSTVSTDTTITFIGDTMASIDSGTFKYSVILGAEPYIARFAIAGTIGATASDVANAYYATEPMKVIGADLQVGTAGTTNATTIDINKAGTTMFTTKPTLATTVASSPTPFTADTTSALALGDKVTIDIDAVQTTAAIDLYAQLYLFPTRFLTLE